MTPARPIDALWEGTALRWWRTKLVLRFVAVIVGGAVLFALAGMIYFMSGIWVGQKDTYTAVDEQKAEILGEAQSFLTSAMEGSGLRVLSFDDAARARVRVTEIETPTGAQLDSAVVYMGATTTSPGGSTVHRTVVTELRYESNGDGQSWMVVSCRTEPPP